MIGWRDLSLQTDYAPLDVPDIFIGRGAFRFERAEYTAVIETVRPLDGARARQR